MPEVHCGECAAWSAEVARLQARIEVLERESRTFWIHEDADDAEEFGAATPEEAIRLWLLHGAGTDEFDPNHDTSICVDDRLSGTHRAHKCRWEVVRDAQHLADLRENADSLDDQDFSSSEVGDKFYTSIGSRVFVVAPYLAVTPKSGGPS